MPSLHAVRNASGSKRWTACPGSIRLSEGRAGGSSDAARLGTAAHALGEYCLLHSLEAADMLEGCIILDDKDDATVVPPGEEAKAELLDAAFGYFRIDADMTDAVQVYLDVVREVAAEMGEHAELNVEKQFSLNWLINYDWDEEAAEASFQVTGTPVYRTPSGMTGTRQLDGTWTVFNQQGLLSRGPMFGTNDCSVLLLFDRLVVIDYKHGSGVSVEVVDRHELWGEDDSLTVVESGNPQLMYYALGAAHECGWAFQDVELIVVQPRCRHADGPVRRWQTTVDELRQFAKGLAIAAHRVEEPDAPLAAGGHCQFCPAAAVCPELREDSFRQAGIDFGVSPEDDYASTATPEDSDEDLEMRMRAIPLLNAFIKSVETEVLRRLRETTGGQACFGKLVRKKSNRTWRKDLTVIDEQTGEDTPLDPFEMLVSIGFPRSALYEEPKAKSPSKIEKLRPAELMASLKAQKVKAPAAWIKAEVAKLSYKPEGGITVAPLSDPRDPVDPSAAALADFDEAAEDFEAVDD